MAEDEDLTLHQKMLKQIANRLMIALIKRLVPAGEELMVPVVELEATEREMLMLRMTTDRTAFFFQIQRMPD